MEVMTATLDDIPSWLDLAAEVEPLFGPMVDDPVFRQGLTNVINAGTAFCVREGDGGPGAPLLGGLLWVDTPPDYEIAWLAVAKRARGQGIGSWLIGHVMLLAERPCNITLQSFAPGIPEGDAAHKLYKRAGFHVAETAPTNPAGVPTRMYRQRLVARPTARIVIQHGDRYLLVQHKNFVPQSNGKWELPGAPIDTQRSPSPEASLRLAVRREFGIEVEDIHFLKKYTYKGREYPIYHASPVSKADTRDPIKLTAHRWFTIDEACNLAASGDMHVSFELDAIRVSHGEA